MNEMFHATKQIDENTFVVATCDRDRDRDDIFLIEYTNENVVVTHVNHRFAHDLYDDEFLRSYFTNEYFAEFQQKSDDAQ